MQYFVYILTNKPKGTLYIGITNDITRRLYEHKNELIKGFTSKYKLKKLVHVEIYDYVFDAIQREKALKHWERDRKIRLIEEHNPYWKNLEETLLF
jgi:putative endonuclease